MTSQKPIRQILILCCTLQFVIGYRALAFSERKAEEEFLIRKKMNEDRIADFYQRFIDLERAEAQRRVGEDEFRQSRQRLKVEHERMRQEFVLQRKERPQMNPSDWEAELRAREKQKEVNRLDYVQRRERLSRLLNSIGRIPEEDEFDLNLNYYEE